MSLKPYDIEMPEFDADPTHESLKPTQEKGTPEDNKDKKTEGGFLADIRFAKSPEKQAEIRNKKLKQDQKLYPERFKQAA